MKFRTTMSALAIVCASGIAQAQSIPMTVFENGDGIELDGLDIALEVIDLGTQVELLMRNDSTIDSRVTTVLFELTGFSAEALSNPMIVNNDDVWYTDEKVAPKSPAGSLKHYSGEWGGTMYGIKPERPRPNVNSLNPGESVSVIFDLAEGYSAADVFDAINYEPGDFRVVMHIQSVGDSGSSVWAVNRESLIPTPGAAALMGLGGLIASRRRRSA